MAIKVLVSGYENVGKTTLISKIDDALIINCDNKEFTIQRLYAEFREGYKGVNSFITFLDEKIKAYKESTKKLPKYIIIDTITHLYTQLVKFNNEVYQNFNIHSNINLDTLKLNDFFDEIVKKGISVVIVAHSKIDEKKGKHIIPSQGQFRDSGSFLSVCNEAIYISRERNDKGVMEHLVHLVTDGSTPCRSLMDHLQPKVEFNSFDVNKWLSDIASFKQENTKFRL